MAQPRFGMLILLGALAILLVVLQVRLWRGEGGRAAVGVLQKQADELAHGNGGLRQRNDALAAEVQDLKSGEAAVEERARSELGMIKPGESFYRVVENAGASRAPDAAAAAADTPSP